MDSPDDFRTRGGGGVNAHDFFRMRLPEGALAALAALVATWPLTKLISGGWVAPVIGLLLAVVVVGCGSRFVGFPAWATAVLQTLTVLIGTTVLCLSDFLAPSRWSELPETINDLFVNAGETFTTFAAPAPLTPGVLFLLTLCLPLVGVLVDLLVASLRVPAIAGLPLLAIFLVSTSNTGEALNPLHFLALAALWLAMLLQHALRNLRGWASTEAFARTPEHGDDRLGLSAFSATARWMGAATLVLAVALPTVIPHFPTQYLADGLAKRQEASSGSVGFTDTLNLAKDLNDRNQTPIFTYATTDVIPPPLKVLTVSSYSGGTWQRDDPNGRVDGKNSETLPDPPGLARSTERSLERINVVGNGMELPYLATPWPVESATVEGGSWYYDPAEGLPRLRSAAKDYSTTYEVLDDNARPSGSPDGAPVPASTTDVDGRSREHVNRAVGEALKGQKEVDPFDKAVAFQDWLRDPAKFTYSLTLAARRDGADGQPLDPLSNFLETRRGYCTQFSTAMVMMARSQGIPARVAVGFLPGTATGSSSYEVRAADAHAWPELYFPGLGWARFEPTPGARSGEVPSYTLPRTDGPEARNTQTRPEDRPTTSAAPTTTTQAAPAAPTRGEAVSSGNVFTSPWFWWTLLALALGGLGAAVIPVAARWRREQAWREAGRPAEAVEAQWANLETRLRDLGVEGPGDRSPRQMEQHYRRRAPLDAEGREALHRAAQTLEGARYGPGEVATTTLVRDVNQIVKDVHDQTSFPGRLSATLFPRSGRDAIAQAGRQILGAPAQAWAKIRQSR